MEGVCHELNKKSHFKLVSNLEGAGCDQTFLEKSSFLIRHEKVKSFE
jgi:hypothetical protein